MLAIEIDNLEKKYGSNLVVDKISLSIESGKVFGFLGPNGAGKTTTIKMLLGLIKPTLGTAKIFGFDVRTQILNISPIISAIVENPTFFPNLSALQTLKTFADYCGVYKSERDLEEYLDKCGILLAAKQKVDTFSLGMKQRLGIAVALLNDPKLIFLDEPTNGLDPNGIIKTRKLFRYLADKEGKTLFISSHLLSEVEMMCDDIAILNKGKIVINGKVSSLLNSNNISIKAKPLKDCQCVLQKYFPNLEFNIDVNEQRILLSIKSEEIPQIIEKLVYSNITVYEVSKSPKTLEQFFHQTVSGD